MAYLVERDGLGQGEVRQHGGEGKLPIRALDQSTVHEPGQVTEAAHLLPPAARHTIAAPERVEGIGRELLGDQRQV